MSCALGQIVYAGTIWASQATYGHTQAPDYMRPTSHYLLVFTLEGEADYLDDTGLRAVLRPGSLLLAAPGVNQSYGPRPGQRWSEFFMWFRGPVFDAWYESGALGGASRKVELQATGYWMDRIVPIITRNHTEPRATDLMKLCRFQQVMADAIQFESGQRSGRDNDWLAHACGMLAEGTIVSPTLADVACSLNVSYSLFRKRFTALTGTSPGRYRNDEIMRRASSMLAEDRWTVAEISLELGFHDTFHFSHRFKTSTGLAPSEFRRRIQSSSR